MPLNHLNVNWYDFAIKPSGNVLLYAKHIVSEECSLIVEIFMLMWEDIEVEESQSLVVFVSVYLAFKWNTASKSLAPLLVVNNLSKSKNICIGIFCFLLTMLQ